MSLSECVCVIIKDRMVHLLRSRGLLKPDVLATHFHPSNCILLTGCSLLFLVRCDYLLSLSLCCVKGATPVEAVFLNVVIKFHRQVIKMPWGKNAMAHLKKKSWNILLFFKELIISLFSTWEGGRAISPSKYPQPKWGPSESSWNEAVNENSNTEPDQLLCLNLLSQEHLLCSWKLRNWCFYIDCPARGARNYNSIPLGD